MTDDLNTLRPEVREAIGYFACSPYSAEDREKARVIRAELLRLDKINRILEIKNAGTLANNLCPDHRDKQTSRPCLACLLEKSEAKLAAALKANRDCVDHFEQMQAELAAIKTRIAGGIRIRGFSGPDMHGVWYAYPGEVFALVRMEE